MNFDIKNRFTDAVMFSCELDAEVSGMEYHLQIGYAVKRAVDGRASAYLSGAYLSDAYLSDADLSGAKWSNDITISRVPIYYITGLEYPVYISDIHMQIGCELYTLSDWAGFDWERIARMDGVRSRRFWKAHGPALLAFAASDKRGVVEPAEIAP